MRVLVVTPTPPPRPERDVHGLYRRLALFIGALGQLADTIEILHFVEPGTGGQRDDALSLEQSRYWGVPVTSVLVDARPARPTPLDLALAPFSILGRPRFMPFTGSAQVAALEAALARGPELVFVHRLAGMAPLFRSRSARAPLVFDLDDIEHRVKLRVAAGATWKRRWYEWLQVPALYWAERRATRMAARTFVCSDVDRKYLASVGIRSGVIEVPNAVAMPPEPPGVAAAPTILFLGAYHYGPNAMAAERLCTRIWPLVRLARPDARLVIAGAAPECIPAYRAPPAGVEFPGFVADLAALYAATRLVCCPLDVGGGTRVKLIEAAGHARPIVATRIGAEGLDFAPGRDILIEEDDAALADACVRVLGDDALAGRLGAAARTTARDLYDLRAIQARVAAELRPIAGQTRGTAAMAV